MTDVYRSIDIRVGLVPTVRTGKRVTLPNTTQPTPRAILTRIGRIDIINQQAAPFSGVGNTLAHQAALPLAQASAGTRAHPQLLGRLRKRQTLEYQHRVGRYPGNQCGGGLLAEGARAMALRATKPFQRAPDRPGVALLCRAGRTLCLETAAGLAGTRVPHREVPAADKQGVAIRIDGNEGVGFVQVNANRVDTFRVGDTERDDDTTEQPSVALDHGHAVDLDGFGTCGCERIWHGIRDALAPRHRPDRERAIVTEAGIAPTRANQEQRRRSRELKRALCGLLVRFGTGVRSGDEPDGCAGHLAADRALHVRVHCTVQRQRRERLAIVVTRRRNALLNALQPCERCPEIRVISHAYRYCALYVHVFYCTRAIATKHVVAVNVVALTAFPRRLKSAVPCGGHYGVNVVIVDCIDERIVAWNMNP